MEMNLSASSPLITPTLDRMRAQVAQDFAQHWQLNDPGHRFEHFNEVFVAGLTINEKLKLGQKEELILLAAFFHDLFTWDRTNHHNLAAEWVLQTEYRLISNLNDYDKKLLSYACREHRASGSGIYSSKFSELMASADRGLASDDKAERLFERVLTCRTQRWSATMTQEKIREDSLEHVKSKYGIRAMRTFPAMWQNAFPGELTKLQQAVADLV